MINYGRQTIDEEDIRAVVDVLRSDFLTQGPIVEKFEQALASYCGARYAIVMNSGTAALHAAYQAIEIESGDEFITAPITFPATANAAVWQGALPVLVDVELDTGNIDVTRIEEKITKKTKALVPIDYTGRPAALEEITTLGKKYGIPVIEDACQALGATYKGRKVGSISDLTVFSFHPVKSITTGEGGAVLTDTEEYYHKMKQFITHGVTKKNFIHASEGPWYFEMQMLGQNYRLTDFQCALGISQLQRLNSFVDRRRLLAERYHHAFSSTPGLILPLLDTPESESAWHLYVIRLSEEVHISRNQLIIELREAGIGANVHHIPMYRHPYYEDLGFSKIDYSKTEQFYQSCLTLPLYPTLSFDEQDYIVEHVLEKVV